MIELPYHHVNDAGGATGEIQYTARKSDGHEGMQMSEQTGSHHHHMNASEMKVESQHFWFLAVGVMIGFLRRLGDGGFWRRQSLRRLNGEETWGFR